MGDCGQVVSWSPRIAIFRNFASQAEVDHILEISSQRLTRSKVVGDGEVVSDGRTSTGVFLTGNTNISSSDFFSTSVLYVGK